MMQPTTVRLLVGIAILRARESPSVGPRLRTQNGRIAPLSALSQACASAQASLPHGWQIRGLWAVAAPIVAEYASYRETGDRHQWVEFCRAVIAAGLHERQGWAPHVARQPHIEFEPEDYDLPDWFDADEDWFDPTV